jgi:hypothetical protein
MFTGATVSDTLAAVLKTDPDWSALPAEVPAAIRRLLPRCLERDPKQRLRDIGEARVALSAPEEDAAPVAAIARRGSGRWWAGLAILFGVIAAVVSAVHFRELPPQGPPVRFQVPPPVGTKFGGSAMALSPDGRQLAFNAINQQGRQLLWVRALDSLRDSGDRRSGALLLVAGQPIRRIYSGGKLKRVEVGGPYGSGPVQILTDTTGGGASWNRDGVIIFGSPAVGLFRVAQGGGVPTLLIKPEEFFTGGEPAALRPWFLPDGNHFLYFALGQHGLEDSGIYLASLDAKGRKRLVLSTQGGVYAPPVTPAKTGHLLYLRDMTLLAQPLNPVSFDPVGEAFPMPSRWAIIVPTGYDLLLKHSDCIVRNKSPALIPAAKDAPVPDRMVFEIPS